MNKGFEAFIACEKSFDEANVVIFGAPFDGTASYRPGARFAPKAIRVESYGIETYSPYQNKDLSEALVFDSGDLELPFGNAARALTMVETHSAFICAEGKRPFMFGGEHLMSLGVIRAVCKAYSDLHIIHIDAHADLREEYQGETLSHATVMRRVWELVGDGGIHQFGTRSGDREEFEFAKSHTLMQRFNLNGLEETVGLLAGKPVYVSLDLDVLDPSALPGTGAPEAGGVGFDELLDALIKLKPLNIVGCDITELSPPYDYSGVSTVTACKLAREMLLII